MHGPLAGIRIVDVTTMISGPLATRILGDQGADVIKVERRDTGDLARGLGGRRRGMAPVFATINRSKRSVALDLKHERGRELIERLVATADVFVQNFRPGVAERMGIGYDALRRVRDDLIYVSISGFGERGPYAHKRVYDPVIQALSGLASVQGTGTDRPRMVRLIVPDKLTGVTAAQAITAALFARERTGQGQHVRLSMLDTMVAFLWPEAMAQHTFVGRDIGAMRPPDARDLIFRTLDGYMTAGTVSDAEWEAFTREVDRPEWAADPRFRTAAGRVKHADARLELMAEVLGTRTTEEWVRRLDAAGVPCAPILSREDLLDDPQLRANALIVESEHPHAGPMRQPRPAERFEATPAAIQRPAPLLGEHTDAILEELGVDAAEREELRREGVLAPDPQA
jgi:crotonobetainyl-CoA:carnitine CoA-transferase CaiB-like acyl-CoA transferase